MADTASNEPAVTCFRNTAFVAVVALTVFHNAWALAQPGMPGYAPHGMQAMPASFAPTFSPHGVPMGADSAVLQAQWMDASQNSVNMGVPGMGDMPCDIGGYGADQRPIKGTGKLITAHRFDDHWCGARFEYLYYSRKNDSIPVFPITSDGTSGPIILESTNVDLDDASGGRVSGYIDFFHSFDLEISWFGGLEWTSDARVESTTNSLYSIYSDFGVTPWQGFTETDQATTHDIAYKSELDNLEMNARWRWAHTTKPITGAWIAGVRYLHLKESFAHRTFALGHTDPVLGGGRGPGRLENLVNTENDLVGFQFGGETLVAVLPGLLVGADAEVGIYGNSAKLYNRVIATSQQGPLIDARDRGQTAFVGEANVMVIYRLLHEIYLRGGYNMLFVEGLALAPESFNANSPFTLPRPSIFNTNGDILLQGFHFGVEAQW